MQDWNDANEIAGLESVRLSEQRRDFVDNGTLSTRTFLFVCVTADVRVFADLRYHRSLAQFSTFLLCKTPSTLSVFVTVNYGSTPYSSETFIV